MQPLSDLRVIAITGFLAGPFLGMTLARLGAEVIKIERPGTGDATRSAGPFAGAGGISDERRTPEDISTRFLKRNQGVKSVTLDLKSERGREVLLDLARNSHVLIENLAPGAMSRMGLGYEHISEANPSLIYCSITGYGQSGPYSRMPAHDPQVQGMSGLMDVNGHPDGPPTRVGFYIGDMVAPLYAAIAISGALRVREETGEGQHLDVSMMDSIMALMSIDNLEEDIARGLPLRMGNNTRAGPTGLYHASDGDVIITIASDEQWGRLAAALDRADWHDDPRFDSFDSRNAHVEATRDAIQAGVGQLTRSEVLDKLVGHGVPCAPVRTAPEALEDQHFHDRGTLFDMRHAGLDEPMDAAVTGFPVLFDGKPLPQPPGAPTLGMHNREVYQGILGLDEPELRELQDSGTI